MTRPAIRIKEILGIDNVSDLSSNRIRGNGIYLYECDNVDIDDENKPHRRSGDQELVISGSGKHSIWSDGETFLYVDGTNFKKMNTDHEPTTLITGLNPTDKMTYVKDNNFIYFSNSAIIGYVYGGLSYPFPEPTMPTMKSLVGGRLVESPNPALKFKKKMRGGQLLEVYNRRLYAAGGNILYFSDATILTRMDNRKNAIPFPGRITMLKAVLDGIYVGTSVAIYFHRGSDPFADFVQISPSGDGEGAKEGTAIVVTDDDIGRGASGKVVYWLSSITGSPYRGLPGGVVTQCQKGLFSMEDLDGGTSILKFDNGYQQYMAICPLIPGKGGAYGDMSITKTDVSGLD